MFTFSSQVSFLCRSLNIIFFCVEDLAELPDRINLRKRLIGRRLQNMPANPTSIETLEDLPNQYKHTFAGENFFLYDSLNGEESDDGRIIIFSTTENLRQLARSSI